MDPVALDVDVRLMEADEFDEVSQLTVAAFDGDEQIAALLDALRESWAWRDELSFVAVDDGSIVGYVLFTISILDAPERLVDVLVLSPVGVRPDVQRRSVGSQLIRSSLDLLESRPEPLVFLEGHPAYYPRFGFRPAGPLGFRKPSLRTPDEAFMVRPLGTESIPEGMSGTLVYPDAFWLADSVGLRG